MNRKVSGREARRTLAQQREQIEEAVIPGIGLLVQGVSDLEARMKALEDWRQWYPLTFIERLRWLIHGR